MITWAWDQNRERSFQSRSRFTRLPDGKGAMLREVPLHEPREKEVEIIIPPDANYEQILATLRVAGIEVK